MPPLFPLLPGLEAHPSAALWIEASRTVLIADVHLGYSWAQRRRGELGPLADRQARDKLVALFDELEPAQAIFLGDLVHAPKPCEAERHWIEDTLTLLGQRAALTAIRGNHDRAFAREFGHLPLRTAEFWSDDRLTAVHGDRLPCAPVQENHILVLGHFHPCLAVRDAAGASHKMPLFLANEQCVILPAFSPFARGYDVLCGLPADLQTCFGNGPISAYIASTTRVVSLGPLHQAVEKIWNSARGAPANFRRRSHQ